jgi:hypothetical protein
VNALGVELVEHGRLDVVDLTNEIEQIIDCLFGIGSS